MTFLLAKDVRGVEDSFYDLLRYAPGTKEDKQAFFSARMKILVPKTNYEVMWDRLVERLERAGAGEALFDYVLENAYPRLRELLEEAVQGHAVDISEADRWVVWVLFWSNGNPRRIGEHLVGYMIATGFTWRRRPPRERAVGRRSEEFEYDVALSFAGEQRTYVARVAEALRQMDVKVFYDEFETVDLWGKDLQAHLDKVYRKMARVCIVFVSEDYVRRPWPLFEAQSALARAVEEKGEYVLPVRFDASELPGLRPTTGYLDANRYTPEQLAEIIKAKLERLA